MLLPIQLPPTCHATHHNPPKPYVARCKCPEPSTAVLAADVHAATLKEFAPAACLGARKQLLCMQPPQGPPRQQLLCMHPSQGPRYQLLCMQPHQGPPRQQLLCRQPPQEGAPLGSSLQRLARLPAAGEPAHAGAAAAAAGHARLAAAAAVAAAAAAAEQARDPAQLA